MALMADIWGQMLTHLQWPLGFLSISCDLSDAAAIEKAFGLIDNCSDGLDILVNNAGICFMSDTPDISTIVICSALGHPD